MTLGGGDAPVSRSRANYVLAILVIVYVFNFVDRQILSILLQPIKDELQVSDTAMGFLTGFAFALFYTFAGIPIARWSDRGTRRTIIAIGLAVWSAMTAASGLARSFVQLAIARVGVGVGEAAASPAAHSMISDLYPPERRATALAIYTMGANLGILLGMILGGWLNELFNWRVAFFVVGLPGLAMALIVRFTVPEPPRGQSEGAAATAGDLPSTGEVFEYMWGMRSFRHVSGAAALYAFAGYGFTIWAPTFLIRVHGMSTGEVGTWFGLIAGIGGAAGALLGGALCDRLGARDARWTMWVPAIGAVLGIPPLVAFLLWPTAMGALLFYIPAIVFSAFYVGPTFSTTQTLAKLRMRALASAFILFVINLVGLGLGPQMVGILNDVLAGSFDDEAIRYSLLIVAVTNLWGVVHSLLAARTLRADLEAG